MEEEHKEKEEAEEDTLQTILSPVSQKGTDAQKTWINVGLHSGL